MVEWHDFAVQIQTTHGWNSLTWGFRNITCIGWAMAMRKRQGKTIAKISHVSNSEALNTSIRKFQIKLKNGHGFNENKQEVVKIALEMTKQKQTSHKCESVHICHWQFPRAQGVQTHLLKSTLAKHSHQASKHTEFLTLGVWKTTLTSPQGWGHRVFRLSGTGQTSWSLRITVTGCVNSGDTDTFRTQKINSNINKKGWM